MIVFQVKQLDRDMWIIKTNSLFFSFIDTPCTSEKPNPRDYIGHALAQQYESTYSVLEWNLRLMM